MGAPAATASTREADAQTPRVTEASRSIARESASAVAAAEDEAEGAEGEEEKEEEEEEAPPMFFALLSSAAAARIVPRSTSLSPLAIAETAARIASMREAMVETAVWRDLKWPTTFFFFVFFFGKRERERG